MGQVCSLGARRGPSAAQLEARAARLARRAARRERRLARRAARREARAAAAAARRAERQRAGGRASAAAAAAAAAGAGGSAPGPPPYAPGEFAARPKSRSDTGSHLNGYFDAEDTAFSVDSELARGDREGGRCPMVAPSLIFVHHSPPLPPPQDDSEDSDEGADPPPAPPAGRGVLGELLRAVTDLGGGGGAASALAAAAAAADPPPSPPPSAVAAAAPPQPPPSASAAAAGAAASAPQPQPPPPPPPPAAAATHYPPVDGDPLDWDSDDEPRVPTALRPRAGATLPHVSAVGGHSDSAAGPECWGEPPHGAFSVRGPHYLRDRVKVPSAPAVYKAVAVDAFTGPGRMDHLMRRLRLPEPSEPRSFAAPSAPSFLPRFFVVNIQVPTYEPRLGSSRRDGPSLSIVLVHELVDSGARLQPQARALAERFFSNGVEPGSGAPSRECLKYIPHIANVDDVVSAAAMSRPERAFMVGYDSKPVMTKPQHRFFRGPGYFEVDIDSHGYTYLARKGMHAYRTHLAKMVFDAAFVLQGGTDGELPEQVLAAARLYRLDFWRQRGAPPSGAELAAGGRLVRGASGRAGLAGAAGGGGGASPAAAGVGAGAGVGVGAGAVGGAAGGAAEGGGDAAMEGAGEGGEAAGGGGGGGGGGPARLDAPPEAAGAG